MALISAQRIEFHRALTDSHTLVISPVKNKKTDTYFECASNSDSGYRFSVEVGLDIAERLGAQRKAKRLDGQAAGNRFESAVQSFLQGTFLNLADIRPGRWRIENVGGSRGENHLSKYEPYRHLRVLADAIVTNPTLATVLGNSYEISPDVIVVRNPEPDSSFNHGAEIVDADSGTLAPIRLANQDHGIVHAVISCKWTLRSDRAQNARSEALNLIRNRKGRTPHIAVVTGEPSPSRIASLALGTGDVDTVYHFALPELVAAVDATSQTEASDMLRLLIDGQRLRDISDLPLDLAI